VLSGRGLCDELIARTEESYRLCCVVVCDLETSRIGAPYIYDISNLTVKHAAHYPFFSSKCRLFHNATFFFFFFIHILHTGCPNFYLKNSGANRLNGLVRFAGRRNLVSVCVPSHFKRSQPPLSHAVLSEGYLSLYTDQIRFLTKKRPSSSLPHRPVRHWGPLNLPGAHLTSHRMGHGNRAAGE
jgi:hypothetical protein